MSELTSQEQMIRRARLWMGFRGKTQDKAEQAKREFLVIDAELMRHYCYTGATGQNVTVHFSDPPCRTCPAHAVLYCQETGRECSAYRRYVYYG